MIEPIPVLLIVEDILSEAALRKILATFQGKFTVRACLGKEGFGFIQKNMPAFNRAAETVGMIVLTDLDEHLCPKLILRSWLQEETHPNLVFRVAIREVEAWLLAHREAFARHLHVAPANIPFDSESIRDPKELVIELVRHSTSKQIHDAIVPGPGRKRKVGPDYNGCLLQFVYKTWSPSVARRRSASLNGALLALDRFRFQQGIRLPAAPAG